MKLETLEYSQYEGTEREWRIEDFTVGDINLIVGQNATGKSRALNIIRGLAAIFTRMPILSFLSGKYNAIFNNDGKVLRYELHYEDAEIISEKLYVDSKLLLERDINGKGKILAVEFDKPMSFQVDKSVVAVAAKADPIQHPFLEDLIKWSSNLRHFSFSTDLGKNHYAIFTKKEGEKKDIDIHNTNKVVEIFKKGIDDFPNDFLDRVINDMEELGYQLENIEIGPLMSVRITSNLAHEPLCLVVKESDLEGKIDQGDLSQGMFRALSLLIQINYAVMASPPSCILIDDIGEGLDYERSSNLIGLITKKATEERFQLIMSTNDRFVMNKMPLKYWLILNRTGNKTKVFNYRNSKSLFDEFELKGLNNFDLITSKYFLKN